MNDEQDWQECNENGKADKRSLDPRKARSLADTAAGREAFLKETAIKQTNANYIFENYYSCILERLHAIVLEKGYSVKNHICLGHYLRDVLKRTDLYRLFDDCRYKRNSLVYYGRKMDHDVALEAIEKSKRLIEELKRIEKTT